MSLDLSKLNFVRNAGDKKIAQCPVCALEGHDLNGKNHLAIFADGKFNCLIDSEHNARIWKIAGSQDGSSIYEITSINQPRLFKMDSWPLTKLDGLVQDYSYWKQRGISEETQKQFRLGVAGKGKLEGRVVHPVLDRRGSKIIGFSGRTIRPRDPRWKIIGPSREFLYPLILSEEHIRREKSVILVEGIGCCLTLWDNGIKNVLCLFGTRLSSKLMGLLVELGLERVYLCLNNESSQIGMMAAEEAKSQLRQLFAQNRVVINLPYKKDFNEMNSAEILLWKKNLK